MCKPVLPSVEQPAPILCVDYHRPTRYNEETRPQVFSYCICTERHRETSRFPWIDLSEKGGNFENGVRQIWERHLRA